MKIIIAGGGIGGLAAYLALKKYLAEISPSIAIKVYESHPDPTSTTATIGGGLGLAPNGLRAISTFCDAAAANIVAAGFQCPTMTFRNAQGTLLGRYVTGRKERYGFDQVFLARASVHQAFVKEVPSSDVEWGKRVKRVREMVDGVEVEFEDGSVDHADLVIGADGVKSTVREAIFGDEFKAEYQGLTGVGGFLPISSLSEELRESIKQDPVTMTFGPRGFFGYAPSSRFDAETSCESLIMWWSTYEVTPAPRRDLLVGDIRAQLLERHGYWKSPYDSAKGGVFSSVISLACGTDTGNSELAVDKDILILPRYVTHRLPHWCSKSGRVILLGDAAHPVPPDSGQGVSCAVEDGLALALLLKHYLAQRPTSIDSGDLDKAKVLEQTKTAYESIRMARITMILDVAKRRGGNTKKNSTWLQECIRDWMLWILCKLPVSINDRMFGYNVETEVRAYLSMPTLTK